MTSGHRFLEAERLGMHLRNWPAQPADEAARATTSVGTAFARPFHPAITVKEPKSVRFVMLMLAALLFTATTSGCTGPVEAAPDEPVLTLPKNQSETSPPAPNRPTLEAAWVALSPEQQAALCREFVISPDDTYALRVAPNPDLSSVTFDTLRSFLTRACR